MEFEPFPLLPRPPSSPAPKPPETEERPEGAGKAWTRFEGATADGPTRKADGQFKVTMSKLGHDIRKLQETPVWTQFEDIDPTAFPTLISEKNEEIKRLKESLSKAKKQLVEEGKNLGKHEFVRLSQEYSQMQAQLHTLETSLTVYAELQEPSAQTALALAKEAQTACQKLSRGARHHIDLTEIHGNVEVVRTQLYEINRLLDLPDIEANPTAKKILMQATALILGSLVAAKTVVEGYSPFFPFWKKAEKQTFEREKEALKVVMLLLIADTQKTAGTEARTETDTILRLTFSGRSIHQKQIKELTGFIEDLNKKTSALLNKVASGEATVQDTETLEELKGTLDKARASLDKLQITYGKAAASGGQFIGRAICEASIVALSNRLKVLESLFKAGVANFAPKSALVLKNLGIALNSSGMERAKAFYEACADLKELEEQVQAMPEEIEQPEAKTLLQEKIAQLRAQLNAASVTIFSEDQTESEKAQAQKERECAEQVARGISLGKDGMKNASIFLTKTMTRLAMFDFKGHDADTLRATVDLSLLALPQNETLNALPTRLLERYRGTSTGQAWETQITQARELILGFAAALPQTDKGLKQIEQLTRSEGTLAELKESMNPEIHQTLTASIKQLKMETPVALTSAEQKLIRGLPQSLPKAPSDSHKTLVQTALAKLMYTATYDPDEKTRFTARNQAQDLMNAMGPNPAYQPIFATMRETEVLKAFRGFYFQGSRIFTVDKDKSTIEQGKIWIDTVFNGSTPWAHECLDVDALPFTAGLSKAERTELGEYIQLRRAEHVALIQDLALLESFVTADATPSWETATQLHFAYDRLSTCNEACLKEWLNGLKDVQEKLKKFATNGKVLISSDKVRIAKGCLASEGKDRDYYEERVVGSESGDRSRRMVAIMGPLLFEALFVTPQQHRELIGQLPTILQNLAKMDENIFKKSPELLPPLMHYLQNNWDNIDGETRALILEACSSKNPSLLIPSAEIKELFTGYIAQQLGNPPPEPTFHRILGALFGEPYYRDYISASTDLTEQLATYVSVEGSTDTYQEFARRAKTPGEIKDACETFNAFLDAPPAYEPSKEEWKTYADKVLIAAAVLNATLKGGTLNADSRELFSMQAEKLLMPPKTQEEISEDPAVTRPQKKLTELSYQLSPEALERTGYATFAADYSAYKETTRELRARLKEYFPFDPSQIMQTEIHPHAGLLSRGQASVEHTLTDQSDKIVEQGKNAYLESKEGQAKLQAGRDFIEAQIEEMKRSPEDRKAKVFSDDFTRDLKKALGGADQPPAFLELLMNTLFREMSAEESHIVEDMANQLREQFSPKLFSEYAKHVMNLMLLHNLQFSGKFAQPISEGEKSKIQFFKQNPLEKFLEGKMDLPEVALFMEEARSLQANLDAFSLRVRDPSTKPLGYLAQEMRKGVTGFLDTAVGKRRLIQEQLVSPAYQQSLTALKKAKARGDLDTKSAIETAHEKIERANQLLTAYADHVRDSFSEATRQKMKDDPTANVGMLLSLDEELTPKLILALALGEEISEALKLLAEAATQLKKTSPALSEKIAGIRTQIQQWFSLALVDVITACEDDSTCEDDSKGIRQALLDRNAELKGMEMA